MPPAAQFEFGVWSLEFGVWSSGFWGWGLKLRHPLDTEQELTVVRNRHRSSVFCGFHDGERNGQRPDSILAGGKRFALTTDGRVEVTHLVGIKIFRRPWIDLLLGFLFPDEKTPFWLLRHHVFGKERSVSTVYLESGAGVADRECVMELRQQSALETNDAHDGVFHPAFSKTLSFR